MSDRTKALELLERTSEQLTDIITAIDSGTLRGRLTAIAEEIDDLLYNEAVLEDPEVEEVDYDDDDEDDYVGPSFELELDDEDDEEVAA